MFNNVLVCVCYRPSNADHEFLQEFSRFLQCVKESKCKNVIILGDFNYPLIQWLDGSGFSDVSADNNFTDVLQEAGLFQPINSPIRGQNVLDLLLTTNEYLIDHISVTDDDSTCVKSDNKAITADIKLLRKVNKPIKRMVYNYKNGDFDTLKVTLTPHGLYGKTCSSLLLTSISRRSKRKIRISLHISLKKLFMPSIRKKQ